MNLYIVKVIAKTNETSVNTWLHSVMLKAIAVLFASPT